MLSIWSAVVDGSLRAVLRFYFASFQHRDDTPGTHFGQKGRPVLSIPHQLQKLYIEEMSETISDVQTLNGEKIFALTAAQYLKNLTNLIRYIAAHWRYGSTS